MSGVAGQFHQSILGTLARASKALHGATHPPLTIGHNGPHNPALIGFGVPDFFGIAMPMRVRADALTEPPAWVHGGPVRAAA